MRLLRKLTALLLYAVVFLPNADYRATSWLRALEMTQTSLDKTLRRRRSKLENDRLARHLQMLSYKVDHEEKTLHRRNRA